jgi:hypothetical protein
MGSLEHAAMLVQAADPSPTSLAEETDFRKSLASLETKMITMQEQLTQLALQLLRERERSVEQRPWHWKLSSGSLPLRQRPRRRTQRALLLSM